MSQSEGEEWHRRRREWFESLHRAAPGTDWRELERRNWRAHLERRNRLRDALTKAGRIAHDGWREVGSDNLAGRTHQAAYDEATDTLYVGSDLGGVWRGHFDSNSPDPGTMSWQPIGDGVYGSSHQVLHLAGPPEVLLKTWGDSWTGEVHRTTDQGGTWQVVAGTVGRPRRLLASGDPGETVFLVCDDPNQWSDGASTTRLYRSGDLGATFQEIRDLGGYRADIWTSRTAAGPLYLLSDNQLETSTDLGGTWSVVGTLPTTGTAKATLTGSEAGAPALYAVVDPALAGAATRLYGSTDAGVTWSDRGEVSDFWGDITSLAASILDPDLVLYGGMEVHRSTDGGGSFAVVNQWWDYYDAPATKLHADIPSIDFVPLAGGGEVLFIATDGGTFFSSDGGATVHNVSLAGLRISQYYSILTDGSDPAQILAGSQDQGFQQGNRVTGSFDQLLSGDYGHLTSSDGTHALVYSVYPGFALAAEKDAFGTMQLHWPIDFPAGESYDWLPAVAADPLDPDTFYLCATHIYEYTRSGNTWTPTPLPHDFAINANEYASALAFAPSDPTRWYAGTNRGRMWYSTDSGQSWTQSVMWGSVGNPWLTGLSIAVDANDPLIVSVGGSGYSNPAAFRSTDGGASFRSIGAGLPPTTVYALATDPGGGRDLYAATEAGPYRFHDATATWTSILDLTAPMTTYWDVESLPDRVRFATYGRGIWDYHPEGLGQLFADNFESGTPSAWSGVVSGGAVR